MGMARIEAVRPSWPSADVAARWRFMITGCGSAMVINLATRSLCSLLAENKAALPSLLQQLSAQAFPRLYLFREMLEHIALSSMLNIEWLLLLGKDEQQHL